VSSDKPIFHNILFLVLGALSLLLLLLCCQVDPRFDLILKYQEHSSHILLGPKLLASCPEEKWSVFLINSFLRKKTIEGEDRLNFDIQNYDVPEAINYTNIAFQNTSEKFIGVNGLRYIVATFPFWRSSAMFY
jgi:hypothetical protein